LYSADQPNASPRHAFPRACRPAAKALTSSREGYGCVAARPGPLRKTRICILSRAV
jgi:hypothetical protein